MSDDKNTNADIDAIARRAIEEQVENFHSIGDAGKDQEEHDNIRDNIIIPPPNFPSTEHIELIEKYKLKGAIPNRFEMIFPNLLFPQKDEGEESVATSAEFIFYFFSDDWFWTISSVLALVDLKNIVKDCYKIKFNETKEQDLPMIIEFKSCIGNPCDLDDGVCEKPGFRIWSLRLDLEMEVEIFKQVLQTLSSLAQFLKEQSEKKKGFKLDAYQDAIDILKD